LSDESGDPPGIDATRTAPHLSLATGVEPVPAPEGPTRGAEANRPTPKPPRSTAGKQPVPGKRSGEFEAERSLLRELGGFLRYFVNGKS
jgi:hypothetical protein